MKYYLILIVLLGALCVSQSAHAYPEMVRHGYANCISCHASPTGGGLLTEYGRALSKELLSGKKFFFEMGATGSSGTARESRSAGEEDFLYGSIVPPRWLSLGGDLRMIQAVRDTPTASAGRFVLMQADLEAMVSPDERVSFLATVGRTDAGSKATNASDFVLSRRHWINVKFGPKGQEGTKQFRFGRFFPAYGLNIEDHLINVRRQLGFDAEQEPYNLELSWIGERTNAYGTFSIGRPDKTDSTQEGAYALQLATMPVSNLKVAANFWLGLTPRDLAVGGKTMAGLSAILGLGSDWYSLLEVDATRFPGKKLGGLEFVKVGREIWQGLHVYLTQEFSKPSMSGTLQTFEAYGIGLNYFPRPHWQVQGLFRKERNFAVSDSFDDVGGLLLHYYL